MTYICITEECASDKCAEIAAFFSRRCSICSRTMTTSRTCGTTGKSKHPFLWIRNKDGEILVSLHPFFSLGESYAVVKCGCISPAFYTVLVSVLTGMCYAVPKTSGRLRHEADAILGQHFDDSGFVWLWFIWQQLLQWCLGTAICSAWVRHSRCAHCGVHAALPILPPVLGYDVFYRRENVLPALRQRCAHGQKCLTELVFFAMLVT